MILLACLHVKLVFYKVSHFIYAYLTSVFFVLGWQSASTPASATFLSLIDMLLYVKCWVMRLSGEQHEGYFYHLSAMNQDWGRKISLSLNCDFLRFKAQELLYYETWTRVQLTSPLLLSSRHPTRNMMTRPSIVFWTGQ